ncbi:hypothetical protein BDV98DRAFT_169867 [Pterulicium gracile]|uniref:Uncharacterized protein n=1 Tax=Pterulicium gracile TaxID=1884261 RepID=A0A5C3QEG5_9AGAR|nr:hypothetical protein BDV98DRAFT_169867 [Pterula gracilis]
MYNNIHCSLKCIFLISSVLVVSTGCSSGGPSTDAPATTASKAKTTSAKASAGASNEKGKTGVAEKGTMVATGAKASKAASTISSATAAPAATASNAKITSTKAKGKASNIAKPATPSKASPPLHYTGKFDLYGTPLPFLN